MSEPKWVKLTVNGNLSRRETRDCVIKVFLEEEPRIKYRYHVETLSDNRRIFLERPTRRFDFDFKVEVDNWGARGTHEEIMIDLEEKAKENPRDFELLMEAIRQVHDCNDVDQILKNCTVSFQKGWNTELLLKVLKWYFILEDTYYWNFQGRDKLMGAIEKRLSPEPRTAKT
jgi:hypothetical protein